MQSMVAHGLLRTHGAVHIDTQQLPTSVSKRSGDSHPESAADTMASKVRADWAMREAWS
jgi:hypothetical protein